MFMVRRKNKKTRKEEHIKEKGKTEKKTGIFA